ncbi:extracellular solute-binding protein [Actinoalloteichus spitiensis]|uniref:extracellular solute-binding protein n=1 Tax=Actinoalloteichus spitiensis TaxID=252394 RepID=UPI00036E41E7|nr:extracellular solute-binding protein [Actinoalloteichus spitiensis]
MRHAPRQTWSRRSFLSALGAGAALAATSPLLTACGSRPGAAPSGAVSDPDAMGDVLPNHVPVEFAPPDLPGRLGAAPGYLRYPTDLVRGVPDVPGKGGEVTAMTPAYWPLPPADNDYYDAVNERLGVRVRFNIVNGSDYAAKLNAMFAGDQLPELTVIPDWDVPPRFGEAVGTVFADLTEHLAGDAVEKYPMLANLPTRAWAYCVHGNRLYGVPTPAENFAVTSFYRHDLFEELGLAPPTTADELRALCEQITDANRNRWACGNLFLDVKRMFGVVPGWSRESSGRLVNEAETEGFREALTFMRGLFADGHVHPTVAGSTTGQEKELFENGSMLMMVDGLGSWHEALARQLPSNPDFDMRPIPPFSHDGGDPVYFTEEGASIATFLRGDLEPERIEELLGILNFCAAPIGTEEHYLVNYGVEGVHSERGEGGSPQLNAKGNQEVTFTYGFLSAPPPSIAQAQYPGYVQARYDWEVAAAQHKVSKIDEGLHIEEPPRLSSLAQRLDDQIQDLLRGRTPLDQLDSIMDRWRSDGGDELREFYDDALSDVGR